MMKKIFQGAALAIGLSLVPILAPVLASTNLAAAPGAPKVETTILGGAMLTGSDYGIALVATRAPASTIP